MSALQLTWFLVLCVLVCGYAVLDGFDLGVGVWTLFAGGDRRRRALIEAISPFWDGNEVWLLAAAGAAFAAFPPVYACVFSAFYPALMLLLFALIFRAVSIPFSHHEPFGLFRLGWHFVVAASSGAALLLLGLVVGGILNGLPLDAVGNFTGGLADLLTPLGVVIGLLSVALMMMHGALYLCLRLEGDLLAWARSRASTAWGATVGLTLATAGAATTAHADLSANFWARPALWTLPVVTGLAIVLTGFLNARGRSRLAFGASVLGILGLLATGIVAVFPRIVPATEPARSLTIAGASSSETALHAMLVVALVGMPVVLAYTAWLYWTFHKPVSHEEPAGKPHS